MAGTSVGKLAELFGNAGAATGALGLTMQVRGTGKDFQGAARHVSGTAKVRVTDGTIDGPRRRPSGVHAAWHGASEGTQGERFDWITA